jgi:SAM-dependent methyltransferase
VSRINDLELVNAEYATVDRLKARRSDRTGWLRGDEAWQQALIAIARVAPHRVLDAGCGEGWFARLIAAPRVVAVDSSAAAVDSARALGLDARVASIERLPFEDGEFDVVVSNWVLYHLSDVDAGLREIRRVLRPSGRFVGVYNRAGHLSELWDAVGHRWPEDGFGGENGADLLAPHLSSVERIDTEAYTLWETREALQTYLDAFEVLTDGRLEAPKGPYPFKATRRNCVFVAIA